MATPEARTSNGQSAASGFKKMAETNRKQKRLPMRGRSAKRRIDGASLDGIDPEKLFAGLGFDSDAAAQIIAAGVLRGSDLFEHAGHRDFADKSIAYFRRHKTAPGEHLHDLLEEPEAFEMLYRLEPLSDIISLAFADNGFAAFQRDGADAAEHEEGIGHPQEESSSLTRRCASDIEPEQLSPLWKGFLYRRKIALMAGNPGEGKSTGCCDIAARVTRGSDWPGGVKSVADPSHVIMISGEDDAGDTIVPRLIAAGADLSKVHIIDDVFESEAGEATALSIDKHMDEIHRAAVEVEAALVIIDPLAAFMGNRDSRKNSDVRALLNKIRRFAFEGNYAVLGVTHFNKPSAEKATSAIYRVMDSLGFPAAARSCFAFTRDPADSAYRLLLPMKANLGPDTQGYRCRIESDPSQRLSPPPARLVWDDEPVEDQRIDDVLAPAPPREQTRKAKEQKIREWLDGRVKPGGKRVPSKKFNRELKKLKFNAKKVRELMPEYQYRKDKEGFGKAAKWWVVRDKA